MIDWSFEAWPAIDQNFWRFERKQPDDHVEFHVDLGCGTVKKARIGVDRFPSPGVNVVMDINEGAVYASAPAPGHDAAEGSENGAWRYHWPWRGRSEPDPHPYEPFLNYISMPVAPRDDSWDTHAQAYRISCGLPFKSGSIESIITHHCFEHVGDGFIPLMDDIYRCLKPNGLLRVIVPLFPSRAAVADQDHKRWFMEDSFDAFCGHLGSTDNPTGSWLDSFSVPYTRARFTKGAVWTTPLEDKSVWEQHRELRVSLRAVK